jgi:4-hydroxy-2-oxoheptanedioate aldolase
VPADELTGLRGRLRERAPLAVAFLDLGSPVSAEVTAMAGFDAVVVDLEHGAGDEAAARAQIVAAEPHAFAVVRTPGGPPQVGRMLDAGAAGVIVPQVESEQHAARAAAGVRYAGARGISALARGNRYGMGPDVWKDRADASAACIVQIERASALAAVDAIAALPDVDALLLGPADLSSDLGCPPDLDGPILRDAAGRIATAASRHGKTAAVHLARPEQAVAFRELGFTMLSCTFETGLLAASSSAAAAALKRAH